MSTIPMARPSSPRAAGPKADIGFFARNPDRRARVRPYIQGEIPGIIGATHVAVARGARGSLIHSPCWLPAGEAVDEARILAAVFPELMRQGKQP